MFGDKISYNFINHSIFVFNSEWKSFKYVFISNTTQEKWVNLLIVRHCFTHFRFRAHLTPTYLHREGNTHTTILQSSSSYKWLWICQGANIDRIGIFLLVYKSFHSDSSSVCSITVSMNSSENKDKWNDANRINFLFGFE